MKKVNMTVKPTTRSKKVNMIVKPRVKVNPRGLITNASKKRA